MSENKTEAQVPYTRAIPVTGKPGHHYVAAPYPVDMEALLNRGWGGEPIVKRSVDTKPT